MRFTQPAFLILLLPMLAGLWFSFRHVHGMAKGRKWFAFVLRGLLAAALIIALAGPEDRRPNRGVATIFLLDRSDSIPEADRKVAEQFVSKSLQALGPDDVGGVIAFGKIPAVDASMTGRRELGRVQTSVDASASDVASAIRLASATFPSGKARRIVLLSDGNETRGDAAGAAQVAATDGITIDTVVLPGREKTAEAAVIALDTPDETRLDRPFDLLVRVESTISQSATLDIDRDGALLKSVPVKLSEGENRILVQDKLAKTGIHRYRATIRARQDGDSRNNIGLGFTSVKGRPRVLLAQADTARRELLTALVAEGWTVDLRTAADLPYRPEEYSTYDAIFFNDISADTVSESQMRMVHAAIRDAGVGFGMVGGENSFLPGGWYGTSIAEALPVDLNVRQRKSFPSTAIAIMVDSSGSMSAVEDGFPKIRLAAKAAEQTVRMLSNFDKAAVASSSDGIEFVVPMQKLINKSSVISQVQRLDVNGGGIYVYPTMVKASEVLNKDDSKVRHHILLADGADSNSQEGAIAVAMQMRANKITTSVVSIGSGKDVAFLRSLAAAGGGRFYLANRAAQLPAIFTQDTAVMSRSAIEEGAFLPRLVGGDDLLSGISATPPLLAYCLTDRRPLAKTSMLAKQEDPLLATWQYGLGTSLAFTSDATARWARNWIGWPGFGAFWSQATRAISRRNTLNQYQAVVTQNAGKGQVEIAASDSLGNPVINNEAKVRLVGPTGKAADVPMTQVSPGRFTGSFEAGDIGSYLVTVAEPDPKGGVRSRTTGFSLPYPAEYRTVRPNRPLLARMSEVTGGKVLTNPNEAVRAVKDPGESISELWMYFVLFAAVLLPLDIGVRRVALPLREIFGKLAAKLKRAPAPVVSEERVGRLQQAKARATTVTVESGTKVEASAPAANRPKPQVPAPESKATSETLLAAKRKRKSGE